MARGQKPARAAPALRAGDLAAIHYTVKQAGQPMQGVKHAVAGLRRQIEMAMAGLALGPQDVLAHGLSRWTEPASLALAGAALATGARLLWVRPTDGADPSVGEAAAATVVVWNTARPFAEHALPAATRHALCRSEPDPRCPRMRRYVALPETGLIGIEEDDGFAPLLPGGEARLLAAAGDLVEGEGTGMLEVAGAHLSTGYWRRAEATRAIADNEGFFPTGLRGRRRPDGAIGVALQP
jgi:acyl-CoA synthetase (AMP-forming)/AMP-acid ligase II